MVNWRTTILGVATILVAVGSGFIALLDNDPATVFDWAAFAAAITAGAGLIVAKDAAARSGPPKGGTTNLILAGALGGLLAVSAGCATGTGPIVVDNPETAAALSTLREGGGEIVG